jgi:hypothetical protein
LGLIPEHPCEGVINLNKPMIVGGADGGRHGSHTEGLGKSTTLQSRMPVIRLSKICGQSTR